MRRIKTPVTVGASGARAALAILLVISCVLCLSLQAISPTYAQDQTAAGGPDKIKAK